MTAFVRMASEPSVFLLAGDVGTTAERPTLAQGESIGFHYFDTTLGYPVDWDGTQWVKWDGLP